MSYSTHSGLRRFRRSALLVVNLWLILHLIAITSAPATVGPSSETVRTIWSVLRPYLEVLHLNHGYHYFAPEPGSSHLISWTAVRQDGSAESGRFPGPDIQPRLMYHRHFMLSEFLGNADPELQEIVARGFAQHLEKAHNAEAVTLTIVRHDLPSMARIRAGGALDDLDLYEERVIFGLPNQRPTDESNSYELIEASSNQFGDSSSAAPPERLQAMQ